MLDKSITAKKALSYSLLPGIIPRFRRLAQSGFSWIAHLMAVIYYSVRLLPQGHPYIQPQNIGRYGICNVISEASRHLVFKKENIDQIIIFFALLVGFFLLALQFLAIPLYFLFKPALAATTFTGLFSTPNPDKDIAFMMLDAIFGIPGIFGSCVATGVACGPTFPNLAFPSPMHEGLHALFSFYNLAILVVAVLIFLYYVILMVAETAHTGSPFGRRFNHIWAPLRLVVALGLLVPLNYGFNSAQYITLYAAKMGSSFATYGWTTFHNALLTEGAEDGAVGWNRPNPHPTSDEYWSGMEKHQLVAHASQPATDHITQFMMLVVACKVQYWMAYYDAGEPSNTKVNIQPYIITGPATAVNITSPFVPWAEAVRASGYKDIELVFGHHDPAKYPNYYGGVYPFCGKLKIPTKTVFDDEAMKDVADQAWMYDGINSGAVQAQSGYYNWVYRMFLDPVYHEMGERLRCLHDGISRANAADRPPYTGGGNNAGDCGEIASYWNASWGTFPSTDQDPENLQLWSNTVYHTYAYAYEQAEIRSKVMIPSYRAIVDEMKGAGGRPNTTLDDMIERGWGGAGIWYNSLAQWNGAYIGAVKSPPFVAKMPAIMEDIEKFRRMQDENYDTNERYEPYVAGKKEYNFANKREKNIAMALNTYYQHLRKNIVDSPETLATGNMFYDIMKAVFGIDGLFTMRQNDHVHPMVQLIALGRSIVDNAVRNLMIAVGFAAAGGIIEATGKHIGGTIADMIQSAAVGATTMGLTVGFVLYFVLPFLPFIYFFFALSSWVKAVFEAMVGVPLWALAHLRVDGNGLPGETAMNGYFLIFDIFIRPFLTVIGLLASFIIFSAMARTLNGIFSLLTENLAGFDCGTGCTSGDTIFIKRSVVDQFFFTVVYTILVYMIATTSFKLIDQIPDGILRWMGTGAKTFSDIDGDPVGNFTQYAAFGASGIAQQGVGAAVQGSRALGGAAGGLVNSLSKTPATQAIKGTKG